ncbi:hypothetical protein E4U12_006959 [Claviceps purpurea]|nr:hypothetical protein E4U12_006959 [Claviceps purpurea]
MEVDHHNDTLIKLASGEKVAEVCWPELRAHILARLDKIAHNDFSIPKLTPLPSPPSPPRTTTTTIANTTVNTETTNSFSSKEDRRPPSSPSSPSEQPSSIQEANKDNAPAENTAAAAAAAAAEHEIRDSIAPTELPRQFNNMLVAIRKHIEMFDKNPPNTIQRLAELILQPKAHYRNLAPYLHALNRVVRVTSGANIYPLPPATFDPSRLRLNGDAAQDGDAAAQSVAWSNPTLALGTDEDLGGALLTPIPWLTRRSLSPEGDNDRGTTPTVSARSGAQIHSEATETIDGPNGVGRIETVSVSVNGIPSTGHHARGVQEHLAGAVPGSLSTRAEESSDASPRQTPEKDQDQDQKDANEKQDQDQRQGDDQEQQEGPTSPSNEEEIPHARGPHTIGIRETGPQGSTKNYVAEDGSVSMQGTDVEAALGRKQDDDHKADDDAGSPSSSESAGTKREAQQALEAEHAKKVKQDMEAEAERALPAVVGDEAVPVSGGGGAAVEEEKKGEREGEKEEKKEGREEKKEEKEEGGEEEKEGKEEKEEKEENEEKKEEKEEKKENEEKKEEKEEKKEEKEEKKGEKEEKKEEKEEKKEEKEEKEEGDEKT